MEKVGGLIKNKNDPSILTEENIKDEVLQDLIPDKITECNIIKKDSEVCSSQDALNIMKNLIDAPHIENPKEIVEETKKKTDCDSEKCIITSSLFRSNSSPNLINSELNNYKVKGPTNVDWLSNIHIDATLDSWTKKFNDFYHCDFSMVDYNTKGDQLAISNLAEIYEEGYKTFGCVINTDKYTGKGVHWMALFVDMRDDKKCTIEFFNSSGNSPQVNYVEWLVRTKNQLESIHKEVEIIKVCRIRHQNSKTECGVYSLFYIWARLNGYPASYFMENIIDDKLMMEFRLHLFEDGRRDKTDKFNYKEQFAKIAQWEPDAGKS
jgi:hypothetical protein